jgi:hypothetical protein
MITHTSMHTPGALTCHAMLVLLVLIDMLLISLSHHLDTTLTIMCTTGLVVNRAYYEATAKS